MLSNPDQTITQNDSSIQILNADTYVSQSSLENEAESFVQLKSLRLKYPKNILIGYININSIRNKFESFSMMVKDYLDVLIISETKIDSTFPDSQFQILGFKKPLRLDVTENSGGILVYVRDNLISRKIPNINVPDDIQVIPFDINVRKQKWLLLPIYRPPHQNQAYFTEQLSQLLDRLSGFENVLVFGDFNMEPNNHHLCSLLEKHDLINIVKGPTCFKSSKGRCIDLILTNKRHSLMKTQSFETGFSDHHHLIYTILKQPTARFLQKNWYIETTKNVQKSALC